MGSNLFLVGERLPGRALPFHVGARTNSLLALSPQRSTSGESRLDSIIAT